MNEEILSALKEIASELKVRNELTKDAAAKTEERMTDIQSRSRLMLGMREESEERTEMARKNAKKRETDRAEFEKQLIDELRRINANLEALQRKGLPL